MPEYKDYFLNLEDVEKHNSFIGRKPNMEIGRAHV